MKVESQSYIAKNDILENGQKERRKSPLKKILPEKWSKLESDLLKKHFKGNI